MNKCETGDYSAVTITFFFIDTYLYGSKFSTGPICLNLILKLKNPNDRDCTSVAVPFYNCIGI